MSIFLVNLLLVCKFLTRIVEFWSKLLTVMLMWLQSLYSNKNLRYRNYGSNSELDSHWSSFLFIRLLLNVGPDRSRALPFFHAFSGCDTTSSLSGKSKKSFFETWEVLEEMTPIFCRLPTLNLPENVTEADLKLLENFVVLLLYSKTCNTVEVNEARRILLARDNRSIENIPPTTAALKEHILRCILQASKWFQSLNKQYDNRDPCLWGQQRVENKVLPRWTKLMKCSCKKSCSGRYNCYKADLQCTELCKCTGQCTNSQN